MKIQRMVHINNNPVEEDGCRLKPDSYSGIYTNTVNKSQFYIVDDNRREKYEVKKDVKNPILS